MNYIIEEKINPWIVPGLPKLALIKSKAFILEDITVKVCNYFNKGLQETRGGCNDRPLSDCRKIAMYFLRKQESLTLKDIGAYFNGRDHSTIINAVKVVNDLMDTDKIFRMNVENIKQLLE